MQRVTPAYPYFPLEKQFCEQHHWKQGINPLLTDWMIIFAADLRPRVEGSGRENVHLLQACRVDKDSLESNAFWGALFERPE